MPRRTHPASHARRPATHGVRSAAPRRVLAAALAAALLALGVPAAHAAGSADRTGPTPAGAPAPVAAGPALAGEELPEGESDGVGVDESDSHPDDGEGDSGVIVVGIAVVSVLVLAVAAAFLMRGRDRRKLDRH